MKKWFDEEYEFTVEVTGFLRGDLENLGGDNKYTKTFVCPDGCVMFRLTAKPLGNENFHKESGYDDTQERRELEQAADMLFG